MQMDRGNRVGAHRGRDAFIRYGGIQHTGPQYCPDGRTDERPNRAADHGPRNSAARAAWQRRTGPLVFIGDDRDRQPRAVQVDERCAIDVR